MKFNTTKCEVLRVGNENIRQDYFMGGTKLVSAQVEKDLGVIVDQSFSGSSQCASAVKKKSPTGCSATWPGVLSISLRKLYSPYITLQLDHTYCAQFWGMHYKKDIALEKVQRRATRLIPIIRDRSYEDIIKMLNLFKLRKGD